MDTACDWVKPIYGTDHDWDVLDRQTKKDILAHNKAWQANCVGFFDDLEEAAEAARRARNKVFTHNDADRY